MRPSFAAARYVSVAGVAAIAAATLVAILVWCTLQPPRDWASISCGQNRSDVHQHVPGAMTELSDIKGDFWWSPRVLGGWQLQVAYDAESRVVAKNVKLYFGTRHTFKVISLP